MEIDSDTEGNDEPPPVNETPQILSTPTPSFLPPNVTPSPLPHNVTPSPLPSNVTPSPLPSNVAPSPLPPSLPPTNLPFPPFHPYQVPPNHPHPLAPPHTIPPVSAIPYSPSMPKPYTPIAPLPPPPHFPLLSASPGQSLGSTPTSFSSPAPTPQSAPPTTVTEDHTLNQSKTVPDSFFHDYSDSESESDKHYSPSNVIPFSPEGNQATPTSRPDPSEENVTLSSNNFQFYGSGNYGNDKADQSNSSVGPVVSVNSLSDTINSVTSLVSKNSSTSDNSNKKPYIQPEDIKITPSLTSMLGEIFPQLSKSLGEKRRRESPLPPDPAPNKLPKINTSERGFEEIEPLNSFVNDYPRPESYHVPPNIPHQRFPPPQSFHSPHPHFGFRPHAPRGFPPRPNAAYQGSRREQDLQYPHNQFKPVNNGRQTSRHYY